MKRFKTGKYFEIIASIAVFLILDASILGFNYFVSFQITDDTHALQLASRQTRLSQQILSELYVVRDALAAGEEIEQPVLQLTQSFRQFDEVLDSFIYGGELIGVGQGQDNLLVDAGYAKVNLDLLKQIEAQWRPYRSRISPVMYSIYSDNFDAEKTLEKANTAIAVSRINNPRMLELLNEFSVAVETLSNNKVERLQLIQAVGIAIVVIYFFVLMFYFIRKLIRSDHAAEIARNETEEILSTVNDGLFLLDKDMIIGSQYSASLCTMLNKKNLAGVNFVSLIEPMVSKKTLKTTKDFLELMFADHVQPNLIKDLNPLDHVEMQITTADKNHSNRHFTFSFSAVEDRGQLVHLLVSIVDITEKINLEAELEQSRKQAAKQLDLLLSVMHVKPDLLTTGIRSTEAGLTRINELLKAPAHTEDQLWAKHRDIGRIAHRIKGDCNAIELHSLAEEMHSLEEELVKIKETVEDSGRAISGNDFLPIAVKLSHTHNQLNSLQAAIKMLQGLQEVTEPDLQDEPTLVTSVDKLQREVLPVAKQENTGTAQEDQQINDWFSAISKLAEGIAEQYEKQLSVDTHELDLQSLSNQQFAQIKDVLLQLVRNAAVHGIEAPEQRISIGKDARGSIHLYSGRDAKGDFICVKDDGRGIHLDEIRNQLISSNKMSADQVNALNPKQLLKVLFQPGFSTADTVDMNAGRGIGLDIVKSTLDDCGAKLALNFKPGAYTEFKIRLPEQQAKQADLATA